MLTKQVFRGLKKAAGGAGSEVVPATRWGGGLLPALRHSKGMTPSLTPFPDINKVLGSLVQLPQVLMNQFPSPDQIMSNMGVPTLALNLSEDEKCFRASVDVPGIDPSDVAVETVGDDSIVITATKHDEHEMDEGHHPEEGTKHKRKKAVWHTLERMTGTVSRTLTFPPHSVDLSAVKASIDQGVLTIIAPKLQDTGGHVRRVEIEAQGSKGKEGEETLAPGMKDAESGGSSQAQAAPSPHDTSGQPM